MVTLNLFLAALAYVGIGLCVLHIGMSHIRTYAGSDNTYMRMALEDARRSLLMLLPQIAVVIGWPIAVAYAIHQSIRDQSFASYYSLQ